MSINPMLKIAWVREEKPLIKTFTNAEVKNMIAKSKGADFLSIRNQVLLAMLFDTGIRCYELCCLTTDSIKDSHIVIWGKGNKERVVPKSVYLEKLMFRYDRARASFFKDKGKIPGNYFLSRTGRPLTNSAVEHIVKLAGGRADIDTSIRCSPHTCRHWFAQTQLKNGLDLYSVSRLLGHDNIKITQRYLESMKDDEVLYKSKSTSPLMNL